MGKPYHLGRSSCSVALGLVSALLEWLRSPAIVMTREGDRSASLGIHVLLGLPLVAGGAAT